MTGGEDGEADVVVWEESECGGGDANVAGFSVQVACADEIRSTQDLPRRDDGDVGVCGEGVRLDPSAYLGWSEEGGGDDGAADTAQIVDARVVAAGGCFVADVVVVP